MTKNLQSTELPPSLWAAVTAKRPASPQLSDSTHADVTVIGAGFTGLSTALHLARRGKSVVVLEGKTVGWGGSGRNNGQVIPTLSAADPEQIEARHGEAGQRLVALIRDSADYLFSLARELNIDCEAEQTGWFQPAHSAGRMRLSEKRVNTWSSRGAPARLLDREQATALIGSDQWFGGMYNPTGGHINPLALARGLAAACEELGVKIFEHSPVQTVSQRSPGWLVQTENGQVTSDAVVMATNAYTDALVGGLSPTLAKTVIPIVSWQMATEPLSKANQTRIVPGRQAVSDTRGDLRFFRYDARHRLVVGGALIVPINAPSRLRKLVGERFANTFPSLGTPRFSYVWSGYVGITEDRLPHVHQLGPNYWSWIGCNGRGVALSISMGRELAAAVDGVDQQDLALPVTTPKAIPFHPIARRVARSALAYYRWRDQREPQL